jgi:hypothetical protein
VKLVTYKGRTDGVTRPGVVVDGQTYLLNQPVAVSDSAAKKLEEHADAYKFTVSDDDQGSTKSNPEGRSN